MLADDESLQQEAEALTSCSICTYKYFSKDDGLLRTPKILECMHTFCDQCLIQHLNSVNSNRLVATTNFPCPTCRKTIYVPLKGISAFPTDLKIKQILNFIENLKLNRKSLAGEENDKQQSSSIQTRIDKNLTVGGKSNGNIAISLKLDPKTIFNNKSNNVVLPCKVCQFKGIEAQGLHFCLNCHKLFCSKCKTAHQANKLFPNHRFCSLDDKEKQNVNKELTCSIHKSDFDYFCRNCNEKLCCICVMLPTHSNHRLQSINDTTQSETSNINGPYERTCENIYEEIDSNKMIDNQRDDQFVSLKQEFDCNINSLEKKVKKVDSVRLSSLKTLEQAENNVKQAYNEAKKQLEDSYKNFMASISYNKENLDKLNSFKKDLESKLNSSKKFNAEINKNNFKSSDQNLQKLLESNTTLIEVMNKTVPSYDYRSSKFSVGVKVELGEMVSGDDVLDNDVSELPADTPNTSNRKKYLTEFFGKRFSNAFASEGIRKEALLKTLMMKSLAGKTQQPYRPDIDNKDFMYRGEPHWRIEKQFKSRRCCFIEGGKILVVVDEKEKNVEKKIVFIRSQDGIALNISCDFAGEQTVTDILDVCYNPEKKNLYLLCNTNKNALAHKYKLNISNKSINSHDRLLLKCSETSELQSFTNPFCISSRKDTIAIVHSQGEKVLIMNSKFKKLFELTSCDIRKANYIGIDSKERIHISDCAGKEIKVFQKNGDLDLHFSSTGPRGEVMHPQGIALDDRGNVLVADQSMRCVSLYDRNGNFVDKLVESTFNQLLVWGIAFSLDKNFLAVTTDEVIELFKL